MQPTKLRCEYSHKPLGTTVRVPRLNWILESDERDQIQSSYQIIVSSSPEQLLEENGDLWDSGKIESSESAHIEYRGSELRSRMRCFPWTMYQRYGDVRILEESYPSIRRYLDFIEMRPKI